MVPLPQDLLCHRVQSVNDVSDDEIRFMLPSVIVWWCDGAVTLGQPLESGGSKGQV